MLESRKRRIYHSCRILNPHGELLCLVGEKRAQWYVARGLADVLATEPALEIRLRFEPGGRGHAGDPFYLVPRQNICVVCGKTEDLTLHHVVPYCYRRYLPEAVKGHSCHDLVPLCTPCHHAYETAATRLKMELAKLYGAPMDGLARKDVRSHRRPSAQGGLRASPACRRGIDARWLVIPPHAMETLDVPVAARLGDLKAGEDPVARYQALRQDLEGRNRPGEEGRISGLEGAVWYVDGADGVVSIWKCKPESVEAIHWAAGINKAAVLATCRNLLETQDTLNLDTLKPLLLEEYTDEEIAGYRQVIDECIRQVLVENAFIERVMQAYQTVGLSIHTHKADVMRALSQHFERNDMKKVYSTIVNRVSR